MLEHQEGRASKYTRGRTPVRLVYLEEYESKSEAMQREWAIKGLDRQQKKRLIEETGLINRTVPLIDDNERITE